MRHYPSALMKPSLRALIVCLSVFSLAATTGQAGPFEDIFKSIRNSFAQPQPKPRPVQSRRNPRKQSNETPPQDASDTSHNQVSPSPSPTPISMPPSPANIRVAKATATGGKRKGDIPYGIPVPGKQGFVTSPFSPDSGYIDVRSFPPGTEVKDPYTGKTFLTP
jgi:hypothetical protein